ncbi:Anti-sigma regulatory factor (Ser/Thr protein kinase) [Modestobacter sp. DSM 44400]|uniref:ATP-binding protein n=1 Tax=Modestobacter sp. DSM 44400 TaxID=1550230 RepID=UPI0008964269|nr:ATP-binding protein [Modestobacter sp. DSM 44400]SDY37187.1 Anti-sigma regulatory factor (Ser/Thr protein kinase) [Modestobacter sp. DSM 44400]
MEHDHDGPSGYRHLGHLGTQGEDLAAVVEPVVRQALAAGAWVVTACPEPVATGLSGCWDAGDDVRSLTTPQLDGRPAAGVAEMASLIDHHLPDDGRRLLLVTAVETPTGGWLERMQIEALFNHVLSDRPVDHLCLLGPDAESLRAGDGLGPEDVARATHPFLLTGGGVVANPDYREPGGLLTELQRAVVPDPLEVTEPVLSLIDLDDMRVMRRSVHRALADSDLDQDTVEDFVLAIDEIVANAAEHGVPPVDVRLWSGMGRLLCSITDRGACFDDPLAGYGPAHGDMAVGGMGLWLARRSVDSLVAAPAEESGGGCTVRLVVNA